VQGSQIGVSKQITKQRFVDNTFFGQAAVTVKMTASLVGTPSI